MTPSSPARRRQVLRPLPAGPGPGRLHRGPPPLPRSLPVKAPRRPAPRRQPAGGRVSAGRAPANPARCRQSLSPPVVGAATMHDVADFLGLEEFDFLPTVEKGRYNVEVTSTAAPRRTLSLSSHISVCQSVCQSVCLSICLSLPFASSQCRRFSLPFLLPFCPREPALPTWSACRRP